MTTISNSDGSCKVRVELVDGKYVPYAEIISKTSERVLGLLSGGPKTRRYLVKAIGGKAVFIDAALRSLSRAGRVAASIGPVLNCRRVRVWTILD
jgi:hypothetical protein